MIVAERCHVRRAAADGSWVTGRSGSEFGAPNRQPLRGDRGSGERGQGRTPGLPPAPRPGPASASASTAVAAACSCGPFADRGNGRPRVLAGYRWIGADWAQAQPFEAADLAVVLTTCHRPRRRGRGCRPRARPARRRDRLSHDPTGIQSVRNATTGLTPTAVATARFRARPALPRLRPLRRAPGKSEGGRPRRRCLDVLDRSPHRDPFPRPPFLKDRVASAIPDAHRRIAEKTRK